MELGFNEPFRDLPPKQQKRKRDLMAKQIREYGDTYLFWRYCGKTYASMGYYNTDVISFFIDRLKLTNTLFELKSLYYCFEDLAPSLNTATYGYAAAALTIFIDEFGILDYVDDDFKRLHEEVKQLLEVRDEYNLEARKTVTQRFSAIKENLSTRGLNVYFTNK